MGQRRHFVASFVGNVVESERVSGWSVPFKSEIKSGFRVGASRLHFVSTLCLHASSPHFVPTLRPHTLSLRFVASFVERERASECSGAPFASDALWSPRSPRCIGERMDGERHRRGRRAPAFRLFRSHSMRLYRTTPPAAPAQAHGTANRRVGRAVPVTPLRGVTGEPHTGDEPPRRQGRQGVTQRWRDGVKKRQRRAPSQPRVKP